LSRCNHEHRPQTPVARATASSTVKSELAIVSERLVHPVGNLQSGRLPHRFHAASA
jgi:hypothetical protein